MKAIFDEHLGFELRTALVLCAILWADCEEFDEHYRRVAMERSGEPPTQIKNEENRHIVTIIHLLNYGCELITRVLNEFYEWFSCFVYMDYQELSESLEYLFNTGLLSKSNKRLFINPDFKLWFLDTFAGIGTLVNGNAKRLKEVFHSVDGYIRDLEQKVSFSDVKHIATDYITEQEYKTAIDAAFNDTWMNSYYEDIKNE